MQYNAERRKRISQAGIKKKKKRISALDKYVIFSFTVLLIYTVAQTIVTIKTGTVITFA